MRRSGARTTLAFLGGAALLAALVWLAGPGRLLDAVSRANPAFLALAVAAYAAFLLLRGIRWRMLFAQSAPDVRLSTTTGATAIGWLANSILPLRGGEVLRAAVVARRDKVSLVTSAATVALERVLDLMGLALVAAAALLLLTDVAALPGWMIAALEVAWALPIVALVGLFALVRFRDAALRLSERLTRRLGKVGAKLHRLVDLVLSGLAALVARPRLLAALMPLTLAVAVCQSLVFTFLVLSFVPGTPAALAFAGASVFLMSFIVSVTPGNVGTYEAAFVAVFVALGVPAGAAVPAAVLTHLATTLIVAVAGSAALLALGMDAPRVFRPARAPAPGGSP